MNKFPEPPGEGNLILETGICANTPPNMIYLFNYTEYQSKKEMLEDRRRHETLFY